MKAMATEEKKPKTGYTNWEDFVVDLEAGKTVSIETRQGFVDFVEDGMTPGRARYWSKGTKDKPKRLYHFRDELKNRKYKTSSKGAPSPAASIVPGFNDA